MKETAQHKAEVFISPNEIKTISELAEDIFDHYTYIISAFLVNNPKTTALFMIFKDWKKKTIWERKVFSTKEAAINWLFKMQNKIVVDNN